MYEATNDHRHRQDKEATPQRGHTHRAQVNSRERAPPARAAALVNNSKSTGTTTPRSSSHSAPRTLHEQTTKRGAINNKQK